MFIILIIVFLTGALVEIIKSRWAKECGYNCNKCKVWDCPGKQCIKKSKYFIIPIILISLFLFSNVNAEVVKVNLSELKFNNINLLDLSYYNIPEGNRTLYFDFDFSSTNENATIFYNSIVLCSDAQYTSAYATDPSEVTNIRMNTTSYSCNYSNSSYIGGKVVIITFATYSSGANSIVLYQNANASVQLIDFVVDTSGYVNPINYSSQTLINQNSQIINQNNTIINNQEDIKNNTDEINNNITSDDSDTTSSKCGIICKLKGIFTGIIELPGKILNLLKSLFIPDDFDFVNEFADTLEDKLGFIAQVPISFITFLKDLATATWEDITSITFPEIEVFGYKFWTSQEIDITLILNKLKPYRYVTDIACVCICIAALKRHYDNFGGKS